MNVREITLLNFTTHDRTRLVIPPRGVVVITGENGAGKSSILEGVSWAGYGKTLRGAPWQPWRGDAKAAACVADMVTEDFQITRTRRGAKTELAWTALAPGAQNAPGAASDDPEYETPTKAQEALVQMIGPFDLWRRSHVFSSADATHFTIATDKERKQLIESSLGVTVFDAAVEQCRSDLKTRSNDLAALQRSRDMAESRLTGAQARLKETKQALAAATPPPPPPAAPDGKALRDLDAGLATVRTEVAGLRGRLRGLDSAGGELRATARQASVLLERLRADRCPTCTQAIPTTFRKAVEKQMTQAKADADAAQAEANTGKADIEGQLEELDEELGLLQKKRDKRAAELSVIEHAKAEAARYTKQHAMLENTMRLAEEDIDAHTFQLEGLAPTIDTAQADVNELTETERVLGLKGVRAMILGQSLTGIEALANGWLARLKQGLQITLRSYSENKNGGTNDSISLEVVGSANVGGGYGYKGSSGGERRRLDVALLLSLAEVVAASRGSTPGTLWFDEVFDCLDEEGVDFVAAALSELAQERAVVVITHSKLLLQRLPNAQRLHVARGQLDVVSSAA